MTDEVPSVTTPADIEVNARGVVRRWLAEIAVADKSEHDWRKESETLWELYEGGRKKAHAFNVFWSNTDTLAPALYNSTPQPDVRRRFRDADPLGKAVSQVMERALAYEVDSYDLDASMASAVLDVLVTGRGVARVAYEPRIVGGETQPTEQPAQPVQPERVTDRAVRVEVVQWDYFRRGPGKRWDEVPWIAFRHDFTQDMAAEKFGDELAQALTYTEGKDTEAVEDKQSREIFKTVMVWEIWDRDTRQAHFIAPCYKDKPLLTAPDPLHLSGFFPLPRPMYAVPTTRSLVPIPLYKLYEEQAKELDKISTRINKIVDAMKVRGAYSANMNEVANILSAGENEMIAVANISEIASVGGLDNAIWMMPIDKLKAVLDGLYVARNEIKQTIYELTGLSDIIRGSTDATETASAQKLKSQWGTMRLQKMQREVQRFVRDLFRIKAEIIAEQYPPETLAQITNLQFPTAQDQAQAQQIAMQAQQMGQPPPPEVEAALSKPSWERIGQVLRSDKLREYRVDVETDSTVADTIDRDMTGLKEVVGSVGEVLQGVSLGLPVEVGREIALSIVRRARMGHAVEDALEGFSPPAPGADLEGVREQIMELIKGEGAKMVKGEQAAQEQQMMLTQYDQQIQGALQQVGQVAQGAEQGLVIIAQQQQMILQQLQQAIQALQMVPAMQTTEGVVQTLQGVQEGFQAVIEAVQAPKQVQFDLGKDGVPRGARLTTEPNAALAQAGAAVQAPTVQAVQGLAAQQMAGFEQLAQVFTNGMQAVIDAVQRPKKVELTRDKSGRIAGATARVQ
jgi:hypothetical protein